MRSAIALVLAASLSGACHAPHTTELRARPSTDAELPVTIFLVRHAETEGSTNTERDPALSEAGERRAGELARLLGHAPVTHLYCTEFRRTRATLEPLAAQLELDPAEIAAAGADEQGAALRALPPGSVAVVVGHSNTVPGLVRLLGGEAHDLVDHPRFGGMLRHHEHDRVFVVTRPAEEDGAVQTIELRYGPPNPE